MIHSIVDANNDLVYCSEFRLHPTLENDLVEVSTFAADDAKETVESTLSLRSGSEDLLRIELNGDEHRYFESEGAYNYKDVILHMLQRGEASDAFVSTVKRMTRTRMDSGPLEHKLKDDLCEFLRAWGVPIQDPLASQIARQLADQLPRPSLPLMLTDVEHKAKFYRNTFLVEVVTQNPEAKNMTLREIANAIVNGDDSGTFKNVASVALTSSEAAENLVEQGSDPEFMGLNEDGTSIDRDGADRDD